jgi:hypothetical protein
LGWDAILFADGVPARAGVMSAPIAAMAGPGVNKCREGCHSAATKSVTTLADNKIRHTSKT